MTRIALEKFIANTKGTRVDVPWKSDGHLKGQCVSLVQQYVIQCLGQNAKPRGNAKDWIRTYPSEGLGKIVKTPQKGDIVVFPNEAGGYGHIGIYVSANKIYDQNNLRHDGGKAGYGTIFSRSYTLLRPNTSLVSDTPARTTKKQTVTLPKSATSWRVYPLNKKPVKGNECGYLAPSRFGGLTYDILSWSQPDVAVIKTNTYGKVQIYVAKGTGAVIK